MNVSIVTGSKLLPNPAPSEDNTKYTNNQTKKSMEELVGCSVDSTPAVWYSCASRLSCWGDSKEPYGLEEASFVCILFLCWLGNPIWSKTLSFIPLHIWLQVRAFPCRTGSSFIHSWRRWSGGGWIERWEKQKVVSAVSRYAFVDRVSMYKYCEVYARCLGYIERVLLLYSRTETPKSCPAFPVSRALLPLFGDFCRLCVLGPKLAVILLVLGLLPTFCVMSKRNLTIRSFSNEV